MKMKTKKEQNLILWLMSIMSLLIAVGACGFAYQNQTQIAFVDLEKVYQEFALTKGFERQLVTYQQSEQGQLDSLKVRLNTLEEELQVNRNPAGLKQYQELRETYLRRRQQAMEQEEGMTSDFDTKIWSQLNQYIDDYSKQEGYDFILGANGSGNLMGEKPNLDITQPIIHYINERYHGLTD